MARGLQRFGSATLGWLGRWQNWLVGFALIAALLVGCRLWPHPPLRDAFPQSTAVYDDAGHLLRLTLASDGQYRLWTPYRDFPPQLVDAVLLHEDRWFWWHPGFNPWGLARGAWVTYARHAHPQPRRMPHHRQIGQDPLDVITQTPSPTAFRAGRIVFDRAAVDPGQLVGDRRAGDRHPQLDGSADGVGDKARRLRHGSCGWSIRCVGTPIVTPQDPPTTPSSPD